VFGGRKKGTIAEVSSTEDRESSDGEPMKAGELSERPCGGRCNNAQ
jgi:hypothetical protein